MELHLSYNNMSKIPISMTPIFLSRLYIQSTITNLYVDFNTVYVVKSEKVMKVTDTLLSRSRKETRSFTPVSPAH